MRTGDAQVGCFVGTRSESTTFCAKNSEMKPTFQGPQIFEIWRFFESPNPATHPSGPWSRLKKQRDFFSALEGNYGSGGGGADSQLPIGN